MLSNAENVEFFRASFFVSSYEALIHLKSFLTLVLFYSSLNLIITGTQRCYFAFPIWFKHTTPHVHTRKTHTQNTHTHTHIHTHTYTQTYTHTHTHIYYI